MFQKKDNQELKRLKEELEAIKRKADENLAGWKRALADFSNFKKEQESEKKSFIKFANLGIILEILPVLDNFDAAWKTLPKDIENNAWVKGIGHIKSQLENLIKGMGVEKIGKAGEKFDPQIHEAVECGENKKPASIDNIGSNKLHKESATTDDTEIDRLHRENVARETLKIAEIIQKGYRLHGKVIRPAKVKVS